MTKSLHHRKLRWQSGLQRNPFGDILYFPFNRKSFLFHIVGVNKQTYVSKGEYKMDALMLLLGIVAVGWVLSQISGYAGKKSREREEQLGKKPALSENEKMWECWMDEM